MKYLSAKVKKCGYVVVLVVMTFMLQMLSGCMDTSVDDAKKALDATMNSFISGDKSAIDEYYSFDRITAYLDETEGERFKDKVLSTMTDMTYQIRDAEKISNDAVKINVDMETVDFSLIVDSFINEIISLSSKDDYQKSVLLMDDEEYNKLIADTMCKCIDDGKSNKTSKNIDITMIKNSSGRWIIGGNSEEVLGAMFANLSKITDYLT